MGAAATAACQQPSTSSDVCVAVLHILAVVKEGLYVKLLKHLHFNYRRQGLPHDTSNTAAIAAHRSANYQSYAVGEGRVHFLAEAYKHAVQCGYEMTSMGPCSHL